MRTIYRHIISTMWFMSSGELDIRISRVRFSLSSICSIITSMIVLSLALILPIYKNLSISVFAVLTITIFILLYWYFYRKYHKIITYDSIRNAQDLFNLSNGILVIYSIILFLIVCALIFLGLFLLLIGLLAARDTW